MEKSYYDFMREITSDELYERLVCHGMIAEKLPPIFDLDDFLNYCKKPERTPFEQKKHGYGYITFNSMRNINIPRSIGIPTPMSHERLCRCLAENWCKIQNHYKKTTNNQKWIVSRTHIRKIKGKETLFEMNYKNWRDDGTPEPDLAIGKRYLVCADISRCYPSIYTHALSWALEGKCEAKQNANNKSKWYNKIDLNVRNTKNGETYGILIGPVTSNILSEIILCSIDEKLCEKWEYIRYIDDFNCYVNSRDEADNFLIDINRELSNYGLALNHQKTEIKELPISNVQNWVRQIQDKVLYFEKFHPYVDYKELQSFIDFCIDLVSKNKDNTSIFYYAFKLLSKYKLTANAQVLLTKQAFALSLIYPYIVPLLGKRIINPYSINRNIIEKYINMIYESYMHKNYFEACTYALFYAVENDLTINTFDVEEIVGKNDCILSLLALIYCRKHKYDNELRILKEHAEKLVEEENIEQQWLFVYECLGVGKLKGEWQQLKKQKISFIKAEYR